MCLLDYLLRAAVTGTARLWIRNRDWQHCPGSGVWLPQALIESRHSNQTQKSVLGLFSF